jgi:hypothetical protein
MLNKARKRHRGGGWWNLKQLSSQRVVQVSHSEHGEHSTGASSYNPLKDNTTESRHESMVGVAKYTLDMPGQLSVPALVQVQVLVQVLVLMQVLPCKD